MNMEASLPPQPPPDVPAPPPGPEAIRSRKWMRRIVWLGGISFVICGLVTCNKLFMRRISGGDKTEALSNLKQVGLALFDFETEFGRFPDATTATAVKKATGSPLTLGDGSSNQLFRQLIAAGVRSEKIFWARTTKTPRRPDDVIGTDANTLAPGECAFTYIAGLASSGDPHAPVVMAPAIRGTWKFDPKPFKGKALVLFLDSSAKYLPIDKNGDVILNGMNLFDPRQPYWHGKPPDIKWPE